VTLDGVRAQQEAFQEIADDNDDPFYPGTRAAGTAGYQGSVDYVAGLLEDAGYDVTLDEFEFSFNFPVTLEQLAPVTATYETGAYTGSGFGDVTAAVTPVDINLTPPRANTSGCEAGDFAGFPVGSIALMQRGTCPFGLKALNAEAAGTVAAIIFNQGDTPDREGLIVGTLGGPDVVDIPVVGASFADGSALAAAGSEAHIEVVEPEARTDVNVIAELLGTNTGNVVMAGAHLDSVTAGPGINDNGSGSAAILETALMIAKMKPPNTIRFGWWGAEEEGLVGSTAYVDGHVGRISLRPLTRSSSIRSRRSALAFWGSASAMTASGWSAIAARSAAVGAWAASCGAWSVSSACCAFRSSRRAWSRVSRCSQRSGESVPCSKAS
jgi:Peptidase family M28/PA domain